MYKLVLGVIVLFVSAISYAGQKLYCPENAKYIKIGMTTQQIIAACGPPLSKKKSGTAVTKRVPVQQLIYTSLNSGVPWGGTNNLYQQWSLPTGPEGINLQVNVQNNKVRSIQFNGNDSNALSVCNGGSFQVGDSVSQVYQSCGTPTTVNQSFVNEPVPTTQDPELWVYQVDRYQPPFTLTIINGKLESINQRQ